jgi:hypothetical protein
MSNYLSFYVAFRGHVYYFMLQKSTTYRVSDARASMI